MRKRRDSRGESRIMNPARRNALFNEDMSNGECCALEILSSISWNRSPDVLTGLCALTLETRGHFWERAPSFVRTCTSTCFIRRLMREREMA